MAGRRVAAKPTAFSRSFGPEGPVGAQASPRGRRHAPLGGRQVYTPKSVSGTDGGGRRGDIEVAYAAGFERPAFDTIVASGPNAALPSCQARTARIEQGDLVVLDFGGVLDGYCTRPLAHGSRRRGRAARAGADRAGADAQAAACVGGSGRRPPEQSTPPRGSRWRATGWPRRSSTAPATAWVSRSTRHPHRPARRVTPDRRWRPAW